MPLTPAQKIAALAEIADDIRGDLALFRGQGLKSGPEAIELIAALIAMYKSG